MNTQTLDLLRLLLARLERISADSYWAHRASGIRGSLLRGMDELEAGSPQSLSNLKQSMESGFTILQNAAREKTK